MSNRRYSDAQEKAIIFESNILDHVGGWTNLGIIMKMYLEGGRFYHTWDHALDVMDAVMRLPLTKKDVKPYILAALFHDAVYAPGVQDNEKQSAELMLRMCGSPKDGLAFMLIMETARHSETTRENTSHVLWDFLDCDILSMAQPSRPLLIDTDWNVAAEFASVVSLDVYLPGRKNFLEQWLAKPSIFLGHFYGKDNEWQARQNIHFLSTYEHDLSTFQ